VEREFNGLTAAWVAQLGMGDNAKGVSETVPYQPTPIARKSGVGWNKGTTVILLDDTEGNTWILKGFQRISSKSRKAARPRSWRMSSSTSMTRPARA
jgi:hypothetical protein